MLQNHWLHLVIDGGGDLALLAAPAACALKPGEALVVSDENGASGLRPFVAVLQLAMQGAPCTMAFVHSADLEAFTLHLAGSHGRTLH